jgi:uncharacterized protein
VLEVDVARQRISLSMKKDIDSSEIVLSEKPQNTGHKSSSKAKAQPALQNTMSSAFAKALKK